MDPQSLRLVENNTPHSGSSYPLDVEICTEFAKSANNQDSVYPMNTSSISDFMSKSSDFTSTMYRSSITHNNAITSLTSTSTRN